MTLLLSESDVAASLDMATTIQAMDMAFASLGRGVAVNRPRSHTYVRRANNRDYLFKSMDGAVPDTGYHCVRMSSDLVEYDGTRRKKLPAAPGNRFVGLIMLFDLDELVPVAIMPDGLLQRMRVGATSALAARYLANGELDRVGVIGTGWQAFGQVEGLVVDRTLDELTVFGPTPEHLSAFCVDVESRLGIRTIRADSARSLVESCQLVALATNSMTPVIDGTWLRPGMHVGSVQGHELDRQAMLRADVVVARDLEPPTNHFAKGSAPREVADDVDVPDVSHKLVSLGDVVIGKEGRQGPDDVTLFTGSHSGGSAGLGIQFAAVAVGVYLTARERGLGHEIPTGWFTQENKP